MIQRKPKRSPAAISPAFCSIKRGDASLPKQRTDGSKAFENGQAVQGHTSAIAGRCAGEEELAVDKARPSSAIKRGAFDDGSVSAVRP